MTLVVASVRPMVVDMPGRTGSRTYEVSALPPTGSTTVQARPPRLRVLFVCMHAPGEGAPHQLMAAYWLASRGHDVTAILPSPARGHAGRCDLGGELAITTVPRAQSRLLGYVRMGIAIMKALARSGHDVVVYAQGGNVLLSAWWAFCLLPKRRLVYHTQDFFEPVRDRFWGRLEKFCCRRAGLVVSNEPARARVLASLARLNAFPLVVKTALPASWPSEAFEGSDVLELLKALRQERPDCTLVMHAGFPSAARCGDALLAAIDLLPLDYAVVITGVNPRGDDEVLRPWLRKAASDRRLVLIPELRFGQLLGAMSFCDIGLLLYRNDGIGNFFQCPGRLSEYLRSGLSIVASGYASLKLVVMEHQLGVVCNSESSHDIARAIAELGAIRRARGSDIEAARMASISRTTLAYEPDAALLERELLRLSSCQREAP